MMSLISGLSYLLGGSKNNEAQVIDFFEDFIKTGKMNTDKCYSLSTYEDDENSSMMKKLFETAMLNVIENRSLLTLKAWHFDKQSTLKIFPKELVHYILKLSICKHDECMLQPHGDWNDLSIQVYTHLLKVQHLKKLTAEYSVWNRNFQHLLVNEQKCAKLDVELALFSTKLFALKSINTNRKN